MFRSSTVIASICAWLVVWAGWLIVTHGFHPTWLLAVIVTTSLVTAFAIASYINHFCLLPRLYRSRGHAWYCTSLVLVMISLTSIALLVIRVSYRQLWGPDADLLGAYKHFAIDLFGMAVHVAAAYMVVSGVKWVIKSNRHEMADTNAPDQVEAAETQRDTVGVRFRGP